MADEGNIKVLTAKVGISICRLHFEDTFLDLKDGNIKCTTTKIKDSNHAILLLLETIRQGRRGRLIDHPENVKAGNLTCILCGLALRIIEVCWDRYNTIFGGLVEVCL